MSKFIGFIMVLFLGSVSLAAGENGVLVGLGLLKFDQETEGPQIGDNKTSNTYYDLKIGYLVGDGLYLGGIYSVHNEDSGGAEWKRSLYGVTVGYHNSGWYLDGSYFIDGQLDGGAIEFKKASGIGVDSGYRSLVSSNFFLGVQGSYKNFTFKEYTASGTTVVVDNKVKSELYPMLTLGVIF
jgi:hypothetical protein